MDNPAPTRLRFDTGVLPERDRFSAFFEEIVRRFTGLDLETDDPLGFHAKLDLRRIGAVGLGFVSNAAVATARTVDLVRDGDDRLCVMLLENGAAHYRSVAGEVHVVRSGDAILCDYARPGTYAFTAASASWSLLVPRDQLMERLPDGSFSAGQRLDKDANAEHLLYGYLRSSFDIDWPEGGREAQLFQDHIIDLIALALGAEGEARQLAEERGARAARRIAILREIERRSGDTELSAATIAPLLGITPRYVHLLLEETGKSFTHHVLERRLERAVALLRDPQQRGRKVADIAAEAGFTDLSYFNRTFRRHFGATPSDIRERIARHV